MLPKRSSNNYVRLNKNITNKQILNTILILKKEWLLTEQQVCYRIIEERALMEIEKRKIV